LESLKGLKINAADVDEAREILQEIRDNSLRKQLSLENERRIATFQHQQQLAAKHQATAMEAQKVYPWMGKEGTPEDKVAREILAEHPGLWGVPDGPFILGDLVAGRMARKGKTVTATNAPPAVVPTKLPPSPKAVPAQDNPKAASISAAKAKVIESGRLEDAAKYLEGVLT
jgi:hypothetical protein